MEAVDEKKEEEGEEGGEAEEGGDGDSAPQGRAPTSRASAGTRCARLGLDNPPSRRAQEAGHSSSMALRMMT